MKNKHVSRHLAKQLPGFSLIELALVLIVVGILAGAIFKGQDVLEAARVRAVLNDIDRIRTATTLYRDTFGHWPGNDPLAKARFGESVMNGQGNGIISGHETSQFWVHLAKAGYLLEEGAPASKLGGNFSVEADPLTRRIYLVLSGPEKSSLLTPKQASILKVKAGEKDASVGHLQIKEGANAPPNSCIHQGVFHLATKTPTCILRVELH